MTPKTKQELRNLFRLIRKQIPPKRREEARECLQKQLTKLSEAFPLVASFASMFDEIDLDPLNQLLAEQEKLLLPRIEKGHIVFYQVKEIKEQLQPGTPQEPDPTKCQQVPLTEEALLLVPGLAFDVENFRLGYGKGHYDELLKKVPRIHSLGIAFREQSSKDLLPRDPWDQPVHATLYF